jgi:hypothetical protein
MKLDLPERSDGFLELKLRWAPLFWKITRVAVDYSPEKEPVRSIEIAPCEARDTRRGDILAMISGRDDLYYRAVQGDEAFLAFPQPPPLEGTKRTVLLKTSGYYNLVLPEGDDAGLKEKMMVIFKKKGLDVYSLEKFRQHAKSIGLDHSP